MQVYAQSGYLAPSAKVIKENGGQAPVLGGGGRSRAYVNKGTKTLDHFAAAWVLDMPILQPKPAPSVTMRNRLHVTLGKSPAAAEGGVFAASAAADVVSGAAARAAESRHLRLHPLMLRLTWQRPAADGLLPAASTLLMQASPSSDSFYPGGSMAAFMLASSDPAAKAAAAADPLANSTILERWPNVQVVAGNNRRRLSQAAILDGFPRLTSQEIKSKACQVGGSHVRLRFGASPLLSLLLLMASTWLSCSSATHPGLLMAKCAC